MRGFLHHRRFFIDHQSALVGSDLRSQGGRFHAGAASNVTVELKSNLLAPVRSATAKARREVLRAGRVQTVCHGDAFEAWERGDSRRDDARDEDPARRGPCGSHVARLMSRGGLSSDRAT